MTDRIAVLCLAALLTLHPASVEATSSSQEAREAAEFLQDAEREDGSNPAWEARYVKDTRTTIEIGVLTLMKGIKNADDLLDSVNVFYGGWEKWQESRLFVLENSRDIDVYGNLYSLQVMCRTLRLAVEDWNKISPSKQTQATLEKALWLEKRSARLADPVAEIITQESHSSYLPRRIEIMKEMFGYVDICYQQYDFDELLRKSNEEGSPEQRPSDK